MAIEDRVRLRLEFEDLFYYEAALLDEHRWDDWLALLDDQLRYIAPVRANVHDERALFEERWRLALFDDDRRGIETRIARLTSGAAHADDPPSRVRHFVSNVRVLEDRGNTARVAFNFLVFKSRRERDEVLFCGTREDVWCRNGAGWKLRGPFLCTKYAAERMIAGRRGRAGRQHFLDQQPAHLFRHGALRR